MLTKKRNLILGVLALLVALAAVVPELHHQPATLLERARKIAAVGTWSREHDNYFWLSAQNVLIVT